MSAGDELFVSYLDDAGRVVVMVVAVQSSLLRSWLLCSAVQQDLLLPISERQTLLRDGWGFECSCRACALDCAADNHNQLRTQLLAFRESPDIAAATTLFANDSLTYCHPPLAGRICAEVHTWLGDDLRTQWAMSRGRRQPPPPADGGVGREQAVQHWQAAIHRFLNCDGAHPSKCTCASGANCTPLPTIARLLYQIQRLER